MRALLLLLSLFLLPACTGHVARPRLFGLGENVRERIVIEEDGEGNPCDAQWRLRLENALLRERLKNCEDPAPVPTPTAEPAAVDIPVRIRVEPCPKEGADLGAFPDPAPVLTACCAPK
ncbi:MAG TPA: hypothetical protein VM537_37210 [Anaerolineae bacterium]|nr:hypothetical protein [Anaerolineae bacterium]